jgi:hypothetical protein
MAAMNVVSAGGFSGGKLSFKKMSTGARLCTSQENPQFWAPAIKVRQPDGGESVHKIFERTAKNLVRS